MNLIHTVTKEVLLNIDIDSFIKDLEGRMENMNEEKEYTVDRFENDIAICEDRNTKEMISIPKKNLPKGIKEGSILAYKDGKYRIDIEKEKEISERIKTKMDKLWNN